MSFNTFNIEVKVENIDDSYEINNKENDRSYRNHVIKEEMDIGPENLQRAPFLESARNDSVTPSFNVEVKVEDYIESTDLLKSCTDKKNKKHSSTEKYQLSCKLCPQKFAWKGNLIRHMRVHETGKTYNCHLCNRKFIAKWNLSQHLRVHNNLKYECDVCGKCITDHSRYKSHLREHSGVKKIRKDSKANAKTKLICDICGKSYFARRNLVRHVQEHYEENRSRCHLCMKSYSRREKLNVHLRSHELDKPYSCAVCKKKFTKELTAESHEKRCRVKQDSK